MDIRTATIWIRRISQVRPQEFIGLDKEIKVTAGDSTLMTGVAKRTIATIARTITERGDPGMWFSAAVELELETDGTDK